MRTRIGIILGILILAGAGFYFFRGDGDGEFVPYEDFNDFLEAAERSEADIERYTEQLKEAYRNDTYGGETPEETLNLFISALKAGDTDLAAKYFIIEKQARMAEELAVGKKNGILPLLIADLEKEKVGTEMTDSKYRFRTYDQNGIAEFSFDLIKNEYSSVWKIESL